MGISFKVYPKIESGKDSLIPIDVPSEYVHIIQILDHITKLMGFCFGDWKVSESIFSNKEPMDQGNGHDYLFLFLSFYGSCLSIWYIS